MIRPIRLLALIAVLTLPAFMPACATLGTQPRIQARVVAGTGETVRLFHGGTREAKEEFCLREIVPVYRYYGRYLQAKEVGKVKITQYIGEHYFDAVVVEGEVRDGDVAKKTSAACMIRLPGPEEK